MPRRRQGQQITPVTISREEAERRRHPPPPPRVPQRDPDLYCLLGHYRCKQTAHFPKVEEKPDLSLAQREHIRQASGRVLAGRQCLLGHANCDVEAHFTRERERLVSVPKVATRYGPARHVTYERVPISTLRLPTLEEPSVEMPLLPGEHPSDPRRYTPVEELAIKREYNRLVLLYPERFDFKGMAPEDLADAYAESFLQTPRSYSADAKRDIRLAVAEDLELRLRSHFLEEERGAETERARLAGQPLQWGGGGQSPRNISGQPGYTARVTYGPGGVPRVARYFDIAEKEEDGAARTEPYFVRGHATDQLGNSYVTVRVAGAPVNLDIPVLGANARKDLQREGRAPPSQDEQIMAAVRAWWAGDQRTLDILTIPVHTEAEWKELERKGLKPTAKQAEGKRTAVRAFWREKI